MICYKCFILGFICFSFSFVYAMQDEEDSNLGKEREVNLRSMRDLNLILEACEADEEGGFMLSFSLNSPDRNSRVNYFRNQRENYPESKYSREVQTCQEVFGQIPRILEVPQLRQLDLNFRRGATKEDIDDLNESLSRTEIPDTTHVRVYGKHRWIKEELLKAYSNLGDLAFKSICLSSGVDPLKSFATANIQRFSFENAWIPEESQVSIATNPYVEEVEFFCTPSSSCFFEALPTSTIRSLAFYLNEPLSEKDLIHLGEMRTLKHLILMGNCIPAGFEDLAATLPGFKGG